MNRSPRLPIAMFLATLATMVGCRSASEVAKGKDVTPIEGSASITIPGPSSIRPDGSVRNRQRNRPDGHLLRTSTVESLRFHQVDPWARNEAWIVAADSGLAADEVEGWILITGPRELIIDKSTTADVYDVTLEVWKLAMKRREREREVE